MVGAVGFMFMCCHLESGDMSVLLLFITLLNWAWKDLVGLALEVKRPFPTTQYESKIEDFIQRNGLLTSSNHQRTNQITQTRTPNTPGS